MDGTTGRLPRPPIRRRDAAIGVAGVVLGLAIAAGVMLAAPRRATFAGLGAPSDRQFGIARRVLTGLDPSGRSVVLSDGPAPQSRRFGDIDFIEMWRTTASPAPIGMTPMADPTEAGFDLTQPNGSVLRLVDYVPVGKGGRRTPMHRTRTVDYAVVLQGEIVLVLDNAEVVLKSGDVAVQLGAEHAWENRSDHIARVAFVLLDGSFSQETEGKLGNAILTR